MSKNLWTKKEIAMLSNVVLPLIKNPPINWYIVAGKINTEFDNGRTFRACENKYRRTYPYRISRRWGVSECRFVKNYVILLKKKSPFVDWEMLSKSLNSYYKKNRTPNACKQKYYELIKHKK
jgi:hypothetical protein